MASGIDDLIHTNKFNTHIVEEDTYINKHDEQTKKGSQVQIYLKINLTATMQTVILLLGKENISKHLHRTLRSEEFTQRVTLLSYCNHEEYFTPSES